MPFANGHENRRDPREGVLTLCLTLRPLESVAPVLAQAAERCAQSAGDLYERCHVADNWRQSTSGLRNHR